VPLTRPRLWVGSFLQHLIRRVDAVIDCFDPFYASGTYHDEVVIDDPLAPIHRAPPEPEPVETEQEANARHAAFSEKTLKALREVIIEKAEELEVPKDEILNVQLLEHVASKSFTMGVLEGLDRVMQRRASSPLPPLRDLMLPGEQRAPTSEESA